MKTIKRDVLKLGALFRTVALDRAAVNAETRTIELSFSSEVVVDRGWWREILDHSPGSVRLDRLKSGAPLLVDHQSRDQVGVVEEVNISSDRRGRASVRLGKSPRAGEILQDIADGIRRNVSVGYRVHAARFEEETDGVETYRIMDWEPMEISIVSVPADISVGVGRSQDAPEVEIPITRKQEDRMEKDKQVTTDTPTPAVIDLDQERAKIRKEENTRAAEIRAIGKQHHQEELGEEHIATGKTVEEFRYAVLERIAKPQPVATSPEIGMSAKELKRYSLNRAILQLADPGGRVDGLEREASDAVAKLCKRSPEGFFLPHDVMVDRIERPMGRRDLSVGDATKGGYLVGTDVLVGSMIELLRNRPLVAQLGARTLSGLVGNVAIPKQSGGATAYWLSETGTVTAADQSFGQLVFAPKRLVGLTAFTKELLMQTSLDVEGFVREDLMAVLAIEKDRAAINGSGASGEPVGILNTTGIGSVTFGAAATWAKAVEFETDVADANADLGAMAYLSTPAVRGKWKTISRFANTDTPIWEKGFQPGFGEVNGYLAAATKQVPSDKVIFGNWNDLVFAEWAGIDVIVDPYSSKKTGKVEVQITLHADLGIRHAASFSASSDSGAQ